MFNSQDFHQLTGATARSVAERLNRMKEAMAGDMVLAISPATVNQPAGSALTRTVTVTLKNANGDTHKWFKKAVTTGVSIADTSSSNATIASTTLTFADGVATVPITLAGAWSGGTKQVETATVVGSITGSGNATIVVTSAGMTGSPKTISVPVVNGDGINTTALNIRNALIADSAVNGKFVVSGTGATVVLTARVAVANDATLNISIDNGTCTGLTTAGTSANTTAGVAADTNTLTIANLTLMGNTVTGGTSVGTIY